MNCTQFCSCTQTLSSQGHCTGSRGSKYNKFVCNGQLDHSTRSPDKQYYAYSMKSLNNSQNALPSDFELLHVKVLIFCILSKVSTKSRTETKMPSILVSRKHHLYGITQVLYQQTFNTHKTLLSRYKAGYM